MNLEFDATYYLRLIQSFVKAEPQIKHKGQSYSKTHKHYLLLQTKILKT
jgi:hypothetical protein